MDEELHNTLVNLKFQLLSAFHSAGREHVLKSDNALLDIIHDDEKKSTAFKSHLIDEFKSSSFERLKSCSEENKEEMKHLIAEILVEVNHHIDDEIGKRTTSPIEFFNNITKPFDSRLE
ncbi:MAG: hypothetical protein ACLFTH_00465 [Candidatus Woesearchaeota archaeon]